MKTGWPDISFILNRTKSELVRRRTKFAGSIILGVFFLLFAIYFFQFKIVTAQEFDYNRAYQDYVYNYNVYRSDYLDYVSAKSEYQAYQTLTAQNKALAATQKMLVSRDEALRTYLTALRMKLKEDTNILDYQQNLYYVRLDTEIRWLQDHETRLPSAATLADLVNTSQEMEKRYPQMEVLAYQTLGELDVSDENVLKNNVGDQITQTANKISEMREAGEDTTSLERWMIEAGDKLSRAEDKQSEAKKTLATMETQRGNGLDTWSRLQTTFTDENQYLKEVLTDLKEIIREIKSE